MTGDAVPPPVLDPDALATLRILAEEGGNPDLIATLVGMFTTNAPARLAQIGQAIRDRDAATLALAAHTLKSNCSMLGAMTMAGHCAELEECGERQAFDEAAALLPTATEEFDRTVRAVSQIETVITPPRPEQ